MNGLDILAIVADSASGDNIDNTIFGQIDEIEVNNFKNMKGDENHLSTSEGEGLKAKDGIEKKNEKEYNRDIVVDKVQSSNLDGDFYEVEAIRRKRHYKGQLQYLVKWLGWPENTNTWEPLENLQSVSEIINAFEERLRLRKHRKQRQNHMTFSLKPRKRSKHSTISYNLRESYMQSTPINNLCHSDLPTLPHVLPVDENEIDGNGTSKGKAKLNNMNGSLSASQQIIEKKEEDDNNTKVNEVQVSSRADTNNLGMHFGKAKISEGNGSKESQLKVDSNKQVQGGQLRGAKKRKIGLVKRFQKELYACGPDETHNAMDMCGNANNQALKEGDGFMGNNSHVNKIDETRLAYDLVKILRPIGYSSSTSENIQDDSLLTFMAMRSNGSEVKVDNEYLKAHNPALLINYYEQHFRCSLLP